MDYISGNTFFRAFSADSAPGRDLGQAAGNYENTPCTKIVKGLIGVLTLGVGYGILYAVENRCNVIPKREEFREAAVELHRAITASPRQRGAGAEVSVRTRGGREIKFCETWEGVQIVDADGNVSLLRKLTLEGIRVKLATDFDANYGAYAPYLLRQNRMPADSLLPLSENTNLDSLAQALGRRAPWTGPDLTPVTQCRPLLEFMLAATQFLLREDHQRFGVDVADFLFGNVNYLPAGLAVPDPEIPADVKSQLPQLLLISGNESDEEICEKIRVFGGKLCRDRSGGGVGIRP
ncbi:hypothetical protein [Pandoraea oxalativorans]|uniref:Uncharacterized protein n=1 Tax=Pandoraea oxalativorans TaxID=573737 RepID=A0A192B0V6_9BURK|nr:hypothetical protein [Pandoraea oxalativorans]ANJ86753.1 hypothetical protein MB84_31370 [Pandoraea oxalativorans]